jgi:hypothetical protein
LMCRSAVLPERHDHGCRRVLKTTPNPNRR